MSDLISRSEAITAIQNAYCDTKGGEDKNAVRLNVGLTRALNLMQDLQPVDVKKELREAYATGYTDAVQAMRERERAAEALKLGVTQKGGKNERGN